MIAFLGDSTEEFNNRSTVVNHHIDPEKWVHLFIKLLLFFQINLIRLVNITFLPMSVLNQIPLYFFYEMQMQ